MDTNISIIKLCMIGSIAAFLLSFVLCLAEIPLLKRLKAGQNILHFVSEHKSKSGTPTMGGLGFILASVIVILYIYGFADRTLLVSVSVGLGFLAVGFLDDLLKLYHHENLGLKAWQKLAFQTSVAVLACVYCYQNGLDKVYIPFINGSVSLNLWIFPVGIFVFLATVNSVNLTDGLDGLAGGSSAMYFLCLGGLIFAQNEENFENLGFLAFILAAALLAYLVFNTNKASVFMGDTGSLSLGGFVACLSIFSGNLLYIPLIGVVFVLSSISVILQVMYYKRTGKRLLKMAPIHHHFQQCGFSESKIAYTYALVTLFIGMVCVIFWL